MSGPNTTGVPKTDDYSLGRGALYWATLDANNRPVSYRHLGNAPEFKLTVTAETLDHKSSLTGLQVVDKEITLSQAVECAFSLDEINHENLALVFSGGKATHTNVSVAGFAEALMVADGDLALGRWYDIINPTSKERAYDVDKDNLTVKTNEGSPVTLTRDTDYTLDMEMGRIFILSTSTAAATAIGSNKGLLVTLTARGGASAVDEVQALTQTNVRGALKFIGENPADNDKKIEYQFHKISLKADGDLSLISDDWTKLGFKGKAEKNTTADSASPTLTIRQVSAPSAA